MKPLHFHALVLEITERCNAKCGMCYQAAGPKGSDIRGDSNLPLEVGLRVIDEAAVLPEIDSRLHVSGGEAFIRQRDTMELFRRGRARGFANIGTTTNGFWATNREKGVARCIELVDAGVTYLEISFDHWHLPYVSVDRIRHLFHGARRAGISVLLRTLTSRRHRLEDLIAAFSDTDLMDVMVANSRVGPIGRGCSELSSDEIYYGTTCGCCEDILSITVTPNGNVYPCCSGADVTNALACGNVHNDTLAQAIFKMKTDRMMRHLIHAGSGSLVPIIESLGLGSRLKDKYTNICHLCWDIFKDDELAGALRSHFQEEQLQSMIELLTGNSPAPGSCVTESCGLPSEGSPQMPDESRTDPAVRSNPRRVQ
jgi:MoaA/NifB/PqqE/SkfB family radical SAM enzyme